VAQAETAVVLVDRHAERADGGEPPHDLVGDLRVAFDQLRIDLGLQEPSQRSQEVLALSDRGVTEPRRRMHQVEPEVPEKELFAETRPGPLPLPRLLGDFPRFGVAGHCGARGAAHRVGHRGLPQGLAEPVRRLLTPE
jgi:hypothetical protein